MRFSIRPIVFGIIIGAVLFFVPFRFPFIFLFLFIFFFFRPWRRRGYGWGYPRYADHNDTLPIDGDRNFHSGRNKSPETKITIQ
jgi:hypothetical protein